MKTLCWLFGHDWEVSKSGSCVHRHCRRCGIQHALNVFAWTWRKT